MTDELWGLFEEALNEFQATGLQLEREAQENQVREELLGV